MLSIVNSTCNKIAKANDTDNVLSVVIEIRKLLLEGKAGKLNADNIAYHSPGIGKS